MDAPLSGCPCHGNSSQDFKSPKQVGNFPLPFSLCSVAPISFPFPSPSFLPHLPFPVHLWLFPGAGAKFQSCCCPVQLGSTWSWAQTDSDNSGNFPSPCPVPLEFTANQGAAAGQGNLATPTSVSSWTWLYMRPVWSRAGAALEPPPTASGQLRDGGSRGWCRGWEGKGGEEIASAAVPAVWSACCGIGRGGWNTFFWNRGFVLAWGQLYDILLVPVTLKESCIISHLTVWPLKKKKKNIKNLSLLCSAFYQLTFHNHERACTFLHLCLSSTILVFFLFLFTSFAFYLNLYLSGWILWTSLVAWPRFYFLYNYFLSFASLHMSSQAGFLLHYFASGL